MQLLWHLASCTDGGIAAGVCDQRHSCTGGHEARGQAEAACSHSHELPIFALPLHLHSEPPFPYDGMWLGVDKFQTCIAQCASAAN